MTREEILQERKWLIKKTSKALPGYEVRLLEYNRQVELFNKDLNRKAKEAIKALKVGDIVYLPERFNRKGLWKVDSLLVKNVLLVPVGESDFKGKLKASAEMLIRVQEEDESLVNALDDIGLM
jgi:hypothetical protein